MSRHRNLGKAYEDDYDDVYDDDEYYDEGAGGEEQYPDGELLDAAWDAVIDAVGSAFTEAQIVAALRACDYDAAAAVEKLLDRSADKPKAGKGKDAGKGGNAGGGKPSAGAGSGGGKGSTAAAPVTPITAATASSASAAAAAAAAPSPKVAASPLPLRVTGSAAVAAAAEPWSLPPAPEVPAAVTAELSAGKPRLSVVCIGHVDSGKSTLMGHLLYDLGGVSERTVAKFASEAGAMGKKSFAFAWVLDESATERARGVTTDVAQNAFETATKSWTLLDAPGHRDYVPRLLVGLSQADVAILVLDASPGEFEASFTGGGQTKEHAVLARSFGITQAVVAVNKMDHPGVAWSQARYDAVRAAATTYLLSVGYRKDALHFVPVSGLTGVNLVQSPRQLYKALGGDMAALAPSSGSGSSSSSSAKGSRASRGGGGGGEKVRDADLSDMMGDLGLGGSGGGGAGAGSGASTPSAAGGDGGREGVGLAGGAVTVAELQSFLSWYNGPTLLEALDSFPAPHRPTDKALRLCVSDVYRSPAHGVTVSGRIEGGWLGPHTKLLTVPGNEQAVVKSVSINHRMVEYAGAGDVVDVGVGGVEEQMLRPGQILTWPAWPVRAVTKFKAHIMVLPTVFMPLVPGQQLQLHVHTVELPCNITRMLRTLDSGGHTAVMKPRALAAGSTAVVRIKLLHPVPMETFADHKRLGRIILRYSGRTVAVGMVLKIKR